MNASTQIKKPYMVLPVDPEKILGGGREKIKNAKSDPVINILIVAANVDPYLIAITNINAYMTVELDSMSPGEPPTHLNALIQRVSHIIKMISPGNIMDIGIPSISN